MTSKRGGPDQGRLDRLVNEARRYSGQREQDYRERALKLYPWICGRCGREFTRGNLHELTVHHRDHNHGNNPPDGGNWELLCLFCHDQEHTRHVDQVRYGDSAPAAPELKAATFQPFAGLASLLKKK
jgi:5-methylcytosine-specific restriction endonuclease McrA